MHYADNCSARPRHKHGDPLHETECLDPNQGDLFAPVVPETDTEKSLTQQFLDFHAENPHVYLALRDLARDWMREGKTKCGMGLLYNVARWRLSLRTNGEGMFELNDHHQAFYARALMRFEPDLDGLFDLRRAPEADAWIASFDEEAA